MAKDFGGEERRILHLFQPGIRFIYDGINYEVIMSGKPTCGKGEPKTDIYILAKSVFNETTTEFKISFKKSNADFLENKMNAERAEQLFGSEWRSIIMSATQSIQQNFENRPLIYKNSRGRVEAGSITLGWKFELINKDNGDLSGIIPLSHEQTVDVYAGTNLTGDKRDASVNSRTIPGSGIANFVLFEHTHVSTAQEAISSLITVDEYAYNYPDVYFACKALNYRTLAQKYDGNRPLSVYVKWSAKNGKFVHELIFDSPLEIGGNEAFRHLSAALDALNIESTEDITTENVDDLSIIW